MRGDDMVRLRAHLEAGQRDLAYEVAHALKGVSAVIGAQRVAELADELSKQLRGGADANALAPLLSTCATELKELAAAVRDLPKDAELIEEPRR